MEWKLRFRGDRVEQDFASDISLLFPNYEEFWSQHIVPLTYRVTHPECIFVRAKLRPGFEDMATANYAVFVHLAACHQQLNSGPDPDLFAVEGAYEFYSRLYSVGEAVVQGFLPAVNKLVKQYSRRYISTDYDSQGKPKRKTWRYETRLEKNGRSGLHRDVNAAFERANRYRHQRVHWWGFPARSGKVPGPDYIRAWIGRGLGELARADEKRLAREFVEALPQAQTDLQSIEVALNEIWRMVLNELAAFKYPYSAKAYRKAQAPTKREKLPSWWKPKNQLSSEVPATSGSTSR
jgi:hypothetical protein